MTELGLSMFDERTIKHISEVVRCAAAIPSASGQGLHQALKQLQFPTAPIFPNHHSAFQITFFPSSQAEKIPSQADIEILLKCESVCADIDHLMERRKLEESCKSGLSVLWTLYPNTMAYFSQFMRLIVITKCNSSLGGSNSKSIGLMWLSPSPTWKAVDFAENILHESVHSALFLNHMVYGVFRLPLTEFKPPSGYAISAIRRTSRRYDLAFHSSLVAYVLSKFYGKCNQPNVAAMYFPALARSITELVEKKHNLTDYGKEILRELHDQTVLHMQSIKGQMVSVDR